MTRPIHCGRDLQYGMALHFPAICQTSKVNSEIHPSRRDGVTIRLELISARFLLSRYFRLFQQNRPKEDGCPLCPSEAGIVVWHQPTVGCGLKIMSQVSPRLTCS
jgi:hypothetical protein